MRAHPRPTPEATHIEPTSNLAFTVTHAAVGSTFTYADPATGTNKTATVKSTDVFMVDGVTATLAVFLANLSVGDVVTILPNTPTTGVTTYQLVNKTAASYTSGLVGNVDTSGTDYNIIEPVTGVVLGTIDYNGPNTLYSVNGTTATLATFEANINEGDTVVATGTGADATHIRTIALTNTTVTGTASGINHDPAHPAFFVDTAAGASLGDLVTAAGDANGYVVTSADTFTVDGVTATVSAFNTALSAGDTVTYARAAGIQTVALTNAASAPVTGIVQDLSTLASLKFFVGTATTATTVDTTDGTYSYKVNGVLATSTEFLAALTAGDSVTVQVPDGVVHTTGSAALTDGSLTGPLADVNTGMTTTVDVLSAGDGLLVDNLDYLDETFYTGNTSATYFVNGASTSVPAFSSELSVVANGTKTGTISVVDNGAVTEFRITTATNTASATMTAVVNPGTAADVGNLEVTFTKPVYFPATSAAADFTIVGSITGPVTVNNVWPNALANISNQVNLGIDATTFSNTETLTVTLSATGAAKFRDANGTAATAGHVSVTVAP